MSSKFTYLIAQLRGEILGPLCLDKLTRVVGNFVGSGRAHSHGRGLASSSASDAEHLTKQTQVIDGKTHHFTFTFIFGVTWVDVLASSLLTWDIIVHRSMKPSAQPRHFFLSLATGYSTNVGRPSLFIFLSLHSSVFYVSFTFFTFVIFPPSLLSAAYPTSSSW